MTELKRIVIVGGHGKIALMAASKLTKAGVEVSSIIRNPDHAEDVRATGATPVTLDIERANTAELGGAFAGADAIVFSAGAGGGNPARTRAVDFEAATRSMDAAHQAGVQRFILVSYARSGIDIDRLDKGDPFYPYAVAKHDADSHLRKTDLDYTILGPGRLTLDAASGRIRVADETGELPGHDLAADERVTSRENVAEVIVHVLVDHAGARETVNFYDGEVPIAEAIG